MANTYVNEFDDKRAISGIGGALYFKEPTDSLYAFAFPCESVPSVRGDVDTYEFNIITSRFKGQTEGQISLDKKDVPVLWHRDMIARLQEIADMGELDFLAVAQDYSADQFTATITFKRDDMANDTLKGTVTIIPCATEGDYIADCRSMLKPTVKFISQIPNEVKLKYGDSVVAVDAKVTTGATVACEVVDGATGAASQKATATWSADKVTITGVNDTGSKTEYLLVKLTASLANYQSWSCTIAISVPNTETPTE